MLREITEDIWKYRERKIDEVGTVALSHTVICVTTNGVVNSAGQNIMGAGIALEAASKYPNLPALLGSRINEFGNHVQLIDIGYEKGEYIVVFPTKNNYKAVSNPELIKRSCIELATLAREHPYYLFCLPRPGCGYGQLDWKTIVKPICERTFHKLNNIIIFNK